MVKTASIGPSWNLNRPAPVSQELHSGGNCFLDLSWHINRTARASQDFHSDENSFVDLSWSISRREPASHDLNAVVKMALSDIYRT